MRGALPEQRALEFHDAGGERRAPVGGMRKRAGLARAMALDPEILFFDEPSAGLDPLTSRNLDKLILELRDSLGATVVVVTHELASIFMIADDSIFLDAETKTMRARGNPAELLKHSADAKLKAFLTRGEFSGETATRSVCSSPSAWRWELRG